MKKIKNILKKYPFKVAVIVFALLLFLPPLLIHVIYKIPVKHHFFEAVISPGDMLGYIGAVLTFCATFSLSIIIYIQNKKDTLKAQLMENKVYVSYADDRDIQFVVSDIKKVGEFVSKIQFNIELNILSDTIISDIDLKSYQLRDETAFWATISTGIKRGNEAIVENYRYIDKNKVKVSFCAYEREVGGINFFFRKGILVMELEIQFLCEDIWTLVQMKLILKKKPIYDTVNDSEVYVYKVDNCFISFQDVIFAKRR